MPHPVYKIKFVLLTAVCNLFGRIYCVRNDYIKCSITPSVCGLKSIDVLYPRISKDVTVTLGYVYPTT